MQPHVTLVQDLNIVFSLQQILQNLSWEMARGWGKSLPPSYDQY